MSKKGVSQYVVAGEAFAKMVMHTNKYPHLPVCGALLGWSPKKSAKGDQGSGAAIQIVDYVPFFHGPALAPMLEAAMMLTEERATEQQQAIVGLFQANELADDTDLSPLAITVGAKIFKHNSAACILIWDSALARSSKQNLATRCFLREGESWVERSENFALDEDFDMSRLTQLAKESHRLQDFDNHLENASNDFFNLRLFDQEESKKRK